MSVIFIGLPWQSFLVAESWTQALVMTSEAPVGLGFPDATLVCRAVCVNSADGTDWRREAYGLFRKLIGDKIYETLRFGVCRLMVDIVVAPFFTPLQSILNE